MARTRDFADDETLFRATVATNPKSFRARYSLGLIYLQRDQLEEAIAMFHQALALKPGDVKSRNALAFAYLRQGRVQQGIAEPTLHLTRIGFSRLDVTGIVLALEPLDQAAPGSDHVRAGVAAPFPQSGAVARDSAGAGDFIIRSLTRKM